MTLFERIIVFRNIKGFAKSNHQVIGNFNNDVSNVSLFLAGDYLFYANIDGTMISRWNSAKKV